jgi:hypothetical protein
MKRYAIFFPQFHRVQVNDLAWGVGFTDWALVAAANAFSYWKRRSPARGFYDLSKAFDVEASFETAAGAGIDGFGIYHYRFDDGPELEAVERYLRQSRTPEGFQYFYIWANENWSTRWMGKDPKILKHLSPAPGRSQIAEHVHYLAPFMESDSYTRIEDRPAFVVYRPDRFLDCRATVNLYREEFRRAGLDPAIGWFVSNVLDMEYSSLFDFCYLFEPRMFFNSHGVRKKAAVVRAYRQLSRLVPPESVEKMSELIVRLLNRGAKRYSFSEFLTYFDSQERRRLIQSSSCPVQNIVTCGWNNAPRYRHRFTGLEVPTSEQTARMLKLSLSAHGCSKTIPLLCNAWNEWSEGAAIEPCSYLGERLLRDYLRREGLDL